jgi:two-component system nitrogen regulation sensor histidine kinase NtrY
MTMGQSSPARFLSWLLLLALSVLWAVASGIFFARRLSADPISSVPVPLPVAFAVLSGIAFLLTLLVIGRLWDLFRVQRQKLSGAKMHRRLAGLLSLVALAPAAVAFALTGGLITTLVDDIFVERIDESALVARNLANSYANTVGQQMGRNLILIEGDLRRAAAEGVSPSVSPIGYRRFLTGLAEIYRFDRLVYIDASGKIVASVGPVLPEQPLPPAEQFTLPTDENGQVKDTFRFNSLDPRTIDIYYAVRPLDRGASGYLVGYLREGTQIAAQLTAVVGLRDQNRIFQERIGDLREAANIGFLLLSINLLLGAAWLGLLIAGAIVDPIRRLATAADRVSSGDLASRVEVRRRDGELGELGFAFNDMTKRLAAQRDDLIAAGEEAESRRRFMETMLGAIPAGVISVDREGAIRLSNSSAEQILGETQADLLGRSLTEVLPKLRRSFELAQLTGRGVRESVERGTGGDVRSLVVEISPEPSTGEGTSGFVVTIDDISDLVTAQRTAAWADVARRIAHEIKNPLTPIQLSAERLKRRYANTLEGRDKEIFDQCTTAIVKHVGDIGRMVTEFSSFARMPEPIMAEHDLREIAREAVFPFTVAHPQITFESTLPEEPVPVLCDARLIVQALTNLVKNAAESITESGRAAEGRIEVEVVRERAGARVEVRDNGRGLPKEQRHRLTEPYMTTREKGTGLGLAIVRKAIEDHDGSFSITDREGGGAAATLFLPALPIRLDPGQTEPHEMVEAEKELLHGD